MSKVVWHDLECGRYEADLPVWRELAGVHGGPVLDLGAGTGRVALDLARAGHEVVALDIDADLLEALDERNHGLPVRCVQADATSFSLDRGFPLILAPMQLVQLFGAADRSRLVRCCAGHLLPEGALALAIAEELEPWRAEGADAPVPDVAEHDGWVYASSPVALREVPGGSAIERLRETVSPAGERTVEHDEIVLRDVAPDELVAEGMAAGLAELPARHVPATAEHVGSWVVVLGA